MRNKETREGYEFWDKICALTSYAFLLSPSGKSVQKAEGLGNWIDKHEAQSIVDQAQDEINGLKAEILKLREDLVSANSDKEAYAQNAIDLRRRLSPEIESLYEKSTTNKVIDKLLKK